MRPTRSFVRLLVLAGCATIPSCGGDSSQNLLTQAAVVSGLSVAGTVKSYVSFYFQDSGKFPTSNAEAAIPDSLLFGGQYVESVAVGDSGVITVTFTGHPRISGKTLELKPTAIGNSYNLTWSCKGGSVAQRDRPALCRQTQAASTTRP